MGGSEGTNCIDAGCGLLAKSLRTVLYHKSCPNLTRFNSGALAISTQEMGEWLSLFSVTAQPVFDDDLLHRKHVVRWQDSGFGENAFSHG